MNVYVSFAAPTYSNSMGSEPQSLNTLAVEPAADSLTSCWLSQSPMASTAIAVELEDPEIEENLQLEPLRPAAIDASIFETVPVTSRDVPPPHQTIAEEHRPSVSQCYLCGGSCVHVCKLCKVPTHGAISGCSKQVEEGVFHCLNCVAPTPAPLTPTLENASNIVTKTSGKKNLKNVQLARKRLRKRITLKDIKPNLGTCDTDSPFNINNIMETH